MEGQDFSVEISNGDKKLARNDLRIMSALKEISPVMHKVQEKNQLRLKQTHSFTKHPTPINLSFEKFLPRSLWRTPLSIRCLPKMTWMWRTFSQASRVCRGSANRENMQQTQISIQTPITTAPKMLPRIRLCYQVIIEFEILCSTGAVSKNTFKYYPPSFVLPSL